MATKSLDIIISAKDNFSRGVASIKGQLGALKSSIFSMQGAIAGGLAGVGLGLGFKEVIEAAIGAEDSMARFRASMKLLGVDSQGAADDAAKFASGIQSITTMDDDAVINLMSLGSTLTGLSGGPLQEATTAAIGLSKSLGMEVDPAMRLVAKAINGNFSAFARYGIQLDDTMTDQQKLDAIMRKGTEAFALAEAESQTTGGSMKQLKNSFGDLSESLGGLLLPHLQEFSKWLDGNLPAITKWVSSWKTAGLNIVGTLRQLWPSMQLGALTFIQSLIDNTLSFGGWLLSWIPSIIGGVNTAAMGILEFFTGLWDSVWYGAQRAFARIVDGLLGLKDSAEALVTEAIIIRTTPEADQKQALEMFRANREKNRQMKAGGLNDQLASIDKREAETRGLRENMNEGQYRDMAAKTAQRVKDAQGLANIDPFGFRAGLKEAIRVAQDELDKSSGADKEKDKFKAPKSGGDIAVKGKGDETKDAKAKAPGTARETNPLASLEQSRFLTGVTQAGRERDVYQVRLVELAQEQTQIARQAAESQRRIADAVDGGEPLIVGLDS